MVRVVAVAALLMVVMLAGCSGGEAPEKVAQAPGGIQVKQPRNDTTPPPVAVEATEGALVGLVTNDLGTPIPDAVVAVLGTEWSTRTTSDGRFSITNITPAEYGVRVDHPEYKPVEGAVTIVAGDVTELEVVMYLKQALTGDAREHRHDMWNGQTQVTVADATFPFIWNRPTYGSQALGEAEAFAVGFIASYCVSPNFRVVGNAASPILFDDSSQLVMAGTARFDVTVSWTQTDYPGDSVIFAWRGANSTEYSVQELQSGETFTAQVEPDDWDSSHQSFTNWRFWICPPRTSSGFGGFGVGDAAIGDFDASITLHRMEGPIPFERGHPVLWPESGRITIYNGTRSIGGIPIFPRTSESGNYVVTPEDGVLIPPGTRELVARLEWRTTVQGVAVPPYTDWSLSYRPANVFPFDAYMPRDYTVPDPVASGSTTREYRIAVAPDEVDQVYQHRTNWGFLINWEGEEDQDRYPEPCIAGLTCRTEIDVFIEAVR